MAKTVVVAAFGSLGDLYPCLAMAEQLQARGHRMIVAGSEYQRRIIEGAGVDFRPIRPNVNPLSREMMSAAMDSRRGPEWLVRKLLGGPRLREHFDDLCQVLRDADLVVEHTLIGGLAAAAMGVPRIPVVLSAVPFLSAYDPPVLPRRPRVAMLRPLGPVVNRCIMDLARRARRASLRRLGARLGLPTSGDYDFNGVPLVLALFSRLLAEPQSDWPARVRVTGFVFYDRRESAMPAELARFLEAGEPPLVFTLGSSTAFAAGHFFEQSAVAARRLGRRAVLLVGDPQAAILERSLPDGIVAFGYAPFSEVFPKAAVIVHAGGVGTTALALRAGRPMLLTPRFADQPDNAARAARLGVGRVLSPKRYTAGRVAAELERLLADRRYAERAEAAAERVRAEDGLRTACEVIEALLV